MFVFSRLSPGVSVFFLPSRGSCLLSLRFGSCLSCLVQWGMKELAFQKITGKRLEDSSQDTARQLEWEPAVDSRRAVAGPHCDEYFQGGHVGCESLDPCLQPTPQEPQGNSPQGSPQEPAPFITLVPPKKPSHFCTFFCPQSEAGTRRCSSPCV